MRNIVIFMILSAIAGVVPFITDTSNQEVVETPFTGWPTSILGRNLRQLPLTAREAGFSENLPGRTARFTDGEREYIIRWISEVTRKYHTSAQCLEAVGYSLQSMQVYVADDSTHWSRFTASRNDEELIVYERIYDSTGKSWTDFIEWYWAAILQSTQGPWWSVTIAEHAEKSSSTLP